MAAGGVVTTALRTVALIWASGMSWTSGAVSEVSEERCGDVIRSPEFRLVSPRHPARHTAANYSCAYLVEPYSPATCRLRVAFHAFDVGDCGVGGSVLVGGQEICGHPAGGAWRFFPLDPRGTVISLRSGLHSKGIVFDLTVQQISCLGRSDRCGGEFSNTSIILASPRAVGVYSNKTSCLYIIRPESPNFCQLEISFLNFSLKKSDGCIKERLEIIGQEVLCGVVTGSRTYHWINNELRLWFVTDNDPAGHGFEIHVKQMLCYPDNNTSTISQNTTSSVNLSRNFRNPHIHELQPKTYSSLSDLRYSQLCCGKVYSDKAFVITTPAFPNAVQENSSCAFIIRRNNSDICRLRMTLKYFCVGKEDGYDGCYGDYLEVDGHMLCGCQAGRIMLFSWEMREGLKTLKYVSSEVQNLSLNGFIIEVEQETCFIIKKRNTSHTSFHHEVIGQIARSKLAEDHERLISNNKTMSKGDYEVMAKKHYASKINNPNGGGVNENLQRFQRAVPLDNMGLFGRGGRKRRSPYANNLWQCNVKTWFRMIKEVFWQNGGTSMCPVPQPFACQTTNALEGSLQSPNYPGLYPANLRCCYRISRRAGYCRVQLTMLDFNVELSTGCTKDFLVLGNSGRYCGSSLAATISYLDLVERNYVDLVFVTDSSGSGRGFRAVFRQLPCSSSGPTTSTPTTPPATTWPPSSYYCGDVLPALQFYLYSANYNLGLALCTFTVRRLSQDLCAVQLTLERFNLTCGQESLQIGNEFLCGPQQEGRLVTARYSGNEVQIVYRKLTADAPGGFVIRGQQVADCVQFPLDIPPAPRIQTDACAVELEQPSGETAFPQPSDPTDCSYVFAHQPGSCGLRLTFDRFQTQSTAGCSAEYLQLEGRKFCGSQLFNHSREILFNGSDINVPYLVDTGLHSSDWHFSYSYIKC